MQKKYSHSFNYHQWFCFQRTTDEKKCWAEPEMFIEFETFVLLLECKLTGGPAGKDQMLDFYSPILTKHFKKPCRSLLICKNVTSQTPGPFFGSLEEFLLDTVIFGTWYFRGD